MLRPARQYEEWGVVREGEPVITEVEVDVAPSADSATVHACVDHRSWVIPDAEGGPQVVATSVVVEESADGWLVTEYVEAPEELTC